MYKYELVFMNDVESVQAFAGTTDQCSPQEVITAHSNFVEPGYTLRSFVYQPVRQEKGDEK